MRPLIQLARKEGANRATPILPKASSAYLGAYLSLKMHTFGGFLGFFEL